MVFTEMKKSGKPFTTLVEPFGPALPGVIGSVWVDFDGLIKIFFPKKVPSFIETCGRVLGGIGITGEMDKGTEIATLVELEKGISNRGKPVLSFYNPVKPEAKPAATMPFIEKYALDNRQPWSYTSAIELPSPEKDLLRLYKQAREMGYSVKEIDGPFLVRDKNGKKILSDACKHPDGRIYLNKHLSPARKAYCLAHEIEEDTENPHTYNVQVRTVRRLESMGASPSTLREALDCLYGMQPLVSTYRMA